MVECTSKVMLRVRNVFNIWVGLWSSYKCMFCTCCIVFRECARATQVVDLASAELYICTWRYVEELSWRATYIGSHTWKQLNVNCGGYTSMEIMKVVVNIPV